MCVIIYYNFSKNSALKYILLFVINCSEISLIFVLKITVGTCSNFVSSLYFQATM